MKICHVTYAQTTNYGSCFQEYALDEVLRKMGHNPFLACDKRGEKAKRVRTRIKLFLQKRLIRTFQRPGFLQFEKKYVRLGDLVKEESDYLRIGEKYDTFITGGDVVWNTVYNTGKTLFYLPFKQKYKFSYAASFGKAILNKKDEELARRYLPELDAIGVRERSSAENAARFTDKPVEIVVDPVLLLTREEWQGLVRKTISAPYILVYSTFRSSEVDKYVRLLKKATGLRVVLVSWRISSLIKARRFHYPSPEEWLGLLAGAEYVVTTSFHATVFSTIFHKNFYSFVPKDGKQGIGSRLYDFLEQFGLENRIYTECPAEIDTTAMDFTLADEKIPPLRERSMDFLRRNLEAAEKRLKELEIKH